MKTLILALQTIGGLLALCYFAFVFPVLLSAPSDVSVAMAFLIPGVPVFVTGLVLHAKYNSKKKRKKK